MKDITRDLSQHISRGIRGAKEWKWGPFARALVEFPTHTHHGLYMAIWRYTFQFAVTVRHE